MLILIRGLFATFMRLPHPTSCGDRGLQEFSYLVTRLTVKRERHSLLRQRSPQPPESIRGSNRPAAGNLQGAAPEIYREDV